MFFSSSNVLFQVIFHISFVIQVFRALGKVKYCINPCLLTYDLKLQDFFVFLCFHFQHNMQRHRTKFYMIFSCLGYLSPTLAVYRTEAEERGYFFNSSLPLSPASQTHRHQLGNYCKISRAVTVESLLLYMTSSSTRIGIFCFSSANHQAMFPLCFKSESTPLKNIVTNNCLSKCYV